MDRTDFLANTTPSARSDERLRMQARQGAAIKNKVAPQHFLDRAATPPLPRRFGSISLLIAFPLLLLACSRPAAGLKQIQQQHSGDYIVTVFNESGVLKLRSDHLTVEFRNASTNELANVSNVQIQASMVMPGMGPMFGNLGPPRQDVPGRYDFDADVEMAGQWNLVITFDPKGRAQFALRAQ